jgi:hypothetical protein
MGNIEGKGSQRERGETYTKGDSEVEKIYVEMKRDPDRKRE